MWGAPHLLVADGDALPDCAAMDTNEQGLAALCQVMLCAVLCLAP